MAMTVSMQSSLQRLAGLSAGPNPLRTSAELQNRLSGGQASPAQAMNARPSEAASIFRLKQQASRLSLSRVATSAPPEQANLMGENPDWGNEDFLAVGLAHCFIKDDQSKLSDLFVVEPIPAGALECMDNGGTTCYKHVTAVSLGDALKQDGSLLPAEFKNAQFCDEFDFRAKCAARTWKRPHPQQNLMNLVPKGTVRSDFNFSLEDKRVLNSIREVSDSDNIKQDMSIDVYGRKEEEGNKDVEKLYNA